MFYPEDDEEDDDDEEIDVFDLIDKDEPKKDEKDALEETIKEQKRLRQEIEQLKSEKEKLMKKGVDATRPISLSSLSSTPSPKRREKNKARRAEKKRNLSVSSISDESLPPGEEEMFNRILLVYVYIFFSFQNFTSHFLQEGNGI